ncbi:MAG: TRAP transporter small permease [Pseudomonadota bacterium]|nr:TRAP transporter small permease [Pseudomonadota bacterium]
MIEHLDRVVRHVAFWAGGLFLLALTMVTVSDVIMRTVFNSPILGGRDIAQLFLVIVVSASVAYSGRSGGQVVVELFGNFVGERATRWTDIVVKFIGFCMLLVLSWHLSVSGSAALEFGEASGTLQISYGPFMHLSAAGIMLYAIVLLIEIISIFRGESLQYKNE